MNYHSHTLVVSTHETTTSIYFTKNNDTSFSSRLALSRSPHILSSLLTSYLISFYSARITSYYVLLATLARSSLLVSASWHECFSHAYASWLTCILYTYSPYLASTTVHASLLYLYTSHLVLRVSMHLFHIIHYTTALYLYSVLLGRASSAVVLQRLSNIRCLSCLLCTCSTSSRTGYESESPTNSGVIEDTGNSTCAVYCGGYEEGRGGIQKCYVCWKGQKT